MIRAALFYQRTRARNRVRKIVSRAQRPRDLLALLLGVLVLGGLVNAWVAFALLGARRLPAKLEAAAWAGAGLLLFMLLLILATARRELGLGLARPELEFLLGAPVSRRGVLGFLLLAQQPGVALISGLATLAGLMVLPPGPAIAWALLVAYLVFNGLNLAGLAAKQLAARALARGGSVDGLVPRLPGWLLLGTLIGSVSSALPAALAPDWLTALPLWYAGWIESPAAWPYLAAHAPFAALASGDGAACARVAAALLAIDLALLALVLWRPAPFEEASLRLAGRLDLLRTEGLEAFQRQHQREQERARRKGGALEPPPWALAPSGRPAWALLWKQLVASGRRNTPRRLLVAPLLALIAGPALGQALAHTPGPPLVASVVLYVGLFGAVIVVSSRQLGLRCELGHVATLRALPLSGYDLLLGATIAPALLLGSYAATTLILAAGACSGWAAITDWVWTPIPGSTRAAVALTAWLLVAAFVFLSMAVQAAAVVLFPGWAQVSPKLGLGAMGRGCTGSLVHLAFMASTLGPVLLVVGGGYALLGWRTGAWIGLLVPAAALAAALQVGEALLLLRWVSKRWDAFDPSELPR